MTLRTYFVLMGLLTFMPAAVFLSLFRPPGGMLPPRRKNTVEGWWVGGSLRLLATAVASGGLRVMVVNISNMDVPVVFKGSFDQFTAVVTMGLGAAASIVFFVVYLRYRNWEV